MEAVSALPLSHSPTFFTLPPSHSPTLPPSHSLSLHEVEGGGGVVGPVFRTRVVQPNILECLTTDGESPVGERPKRPIRYLSTTRHVEASRNLRGPSRKAKYSLATDSAPVARAKGGKNPDKGRIVNLKPHAYKRSELV